MLSTHLELLLLKELPSSLSLLEHLRGSELGWSLKIMSGEHEEAAEEPSDPDSTPMTASCA